MCVCVCPGILYSLHASAHTDEMCYGLSPTRNICQLPHHTQNNTNKHYTTRKLTHKHKYIYTIQGQYMGEVRSVYVSVTLSLTLFYIRLAFTLVVHISESDSETLYQSLLYSLSISISRSLARSLALSLSLSRSLSHTHTLVVALQLQRSLLLCFTPTH